jgi:hypothetical protein
MRVAVIFASLLLANAVAADTPCEAPISRSDVAAIKRALRTRTTKPILLIMAATKDQYFPGAVIRYAYLVDVRSGKRERIPQYTRSDLVYVYMRYTDRSHVDVYAVRKVRGHWKISEKKDWFI